MSFLEKTQYECGTRTYLRKERAREGGGLLAAILNCPLYDEIEIVEDKILEAQRINKKVKNQNS